MIALKNIPGMQWLAVLSMILLFGISLSTQAENEDSQDNNTCCNAQHLRAEILPFTVSGSIDSEQDIDFFQIDLPADILPGTPLLINLRAVPDNHTGAALDPYLEHFDQNCQRWEHNDDASDETTDSELIVITGPDGILRLAASGSESGYWPDGESSMGAYELSLHRATQILARLIDVETGLDISGFLPTDADSELWRCSTSQDDPGSCDRMVGFAQADGYGKVAFTVREEGFYVVRAYANGYEASLSGVIAVSEGETYDLGDMLLRPLPGIGMISGRVVDALTGVGLAGDLAYPHTSVILKLCEEAAGCRSVGSSNTDSNGRFYLAGEYPGQFPPGDYELMAEALDRVPQTKAIGFVGEGESVGNIEISLEPFPIYFSDIRSCGDLPREGGVCRYSARVNNRSRHMIEGAAWSTVHGYGIGSLPIDTLFQVASPVAMTLGPMGDSRNVELAFSVPPSVSDDASICVDLRFGEGTSQLVVNQLLTKDPSGEKEMQPFFNILSSDLLFCVRKGVTGFSLLSPDDARELVGVQ